MDIRLRPADARWIFLCARRMCRVVQRLLSVPRVDNSVCANRAARARLPGKAGARGGERDIAIGHELASCCAALAAARDHGRDADTVGFRLDRMPLSGYRAVPVFKA